MDFTKYEALNDQELLVLAYMAYRLVPMDHTNAYYIISRIKYMSYDQSQRIIEKLTRELLLTSKRERTYWGTLNYEISPTHALPVLLYLTQNRPSILSSIQRKTGKQRNDIREGIRIELLSLCTNLTAGTPFVLYVPRGYTAEFVAELLMPLWHEPEFQPYLKEMEDDLFATMLTQQANFSINNDYGSGAEELLQTLALRPGIERHYPKLTQHLQLAHYIQSGTLPATPFKTETTAAYIMTGMNAMVEGDYGLAVAILEKGLTANRTRSAECYEIPLANVLYVVALAKLNTEPAQQKLQAWAKKDNEKDYSTLAAHIIANEIAGNSALLPNKKIASLHRLALSGDGWTQQKLAFILQEWLNIDAASIKAIESYAICDPQAITLNSFCLRFIHNQLLSIKVKQPWEKVIQQISRQEQEASASPNGYVIDQTRTTRFAYFRTQSDDDLELREQTRLKSGKWSAGKRKSGYDIDYASHTDEIDQKMYAYYRGEEQFSLAGTLPILAGTDKLYWGDHAPYTQCTVIEDKPFLTADIMKDSIVLRSNVPTQQLDNKNPDEVLYAFDQKLATYTYYNIPLRARTYLKALLGVGRFPLEAETQLRALFDQIRSVIEIHSELVEGGSTLPNAEPVSTLLLQVMPDHGQYVVEPVCRPLQGGRLTVHPGKGEPVIYDQDKEGKRYQVQRNKKAENKNAEPFMEFIEQSDAERLDKHTYALSPYVLLEMMEVVSQYPNTMAIEWPEGKKLKLNAADTSQWRISLRQSGDWFELEGDVPISDDTIISIGKLLELMGEGNGRFIRLSDDQFLSISDSLRRQLQRIDAVAQTQRGKMRISPIGASLIGDVLNGEIDIEHPKKLDELRQKIRKSKETKADIPATLNATLRDYQVDGYQWMEQLTQWGAGACLADDMGLGKTVQTIALLLNKAQDGASLVVAPASVVPNWRKELAKFAPSLTIVSLNELNAEQRHQAIEQVQANTVVLSTYGLLISEEEPLVEKQWNVICLDEAHSIKNSQTKSSAVCMQLQAKCRLILTGTPIQNHLGELWNLFQFINPGLLGSMEQFTRKYINPIEMSGDKMRQSQLKRLVQPFMLRRTKQEVVAELPDKEEITLPVELSTEEMAIYELIRRQAKAELDEDAASGSLSVNTLAMITKLRMAACSASLAHKNWEGPSSKLDAFCDLVSEICQSGNRVLVFSQFTSFLEMAQLKLKQAGFTDYYYLDGSTPIKKRSKMVDDFQQGKCPLFMISLKAGGLGLNLTGANYVIHLDPWWNPAIEQQATDRAYRIGQEQKVTVYHLISQHTIEEKIVRLHQTKRDLADSLLEGTDMSHKLTAADLLQMIDEGMK